MLARLSALQHSATRVEGGELLAWAALQDGLTPPAEAADPNAWRSWGTTLAQPVAGCIVVFADTDGLRVGVVARVQGAKVYVIAPGATVDLRVVPRAAIQASRRPPLPATVPAPVPEAPVEPPPVTVEALQSLLTHVQAEFAAVHQDIETIKRTAVASVSLTSHRE
jgi:hypothetical protein